MWGPALSLKSFALKAELVIVASCCSDLFTIYEQVSERNQCFSCALSFYFPVCVYIHIYIYILLSCLFIFLHLLVFSVHEGSLGGPGGSFRCPWKSSGGSRGLFVGLCHVLMVAWRPLGAVLGGHGAVLVKPWGSPAHSCGDPGGPWEVL